MLALVDADLLLYRIGYTTMEDPQWVAAARCDETIDGILTKTGADAFRLFMSDSKDNNYRFHLYPFYKANRKQEKPTHYDFLKEHLIVQWGAAIAHGMEADDALAIHQTTDTVIASIDKDLLQVPGLHFNFVKEEFHLIDPTEGALRFYTQMLTGDTSDNIRGCRGIGPVKAAKALAGKEHSEVEMLDAVYNLYQQQEEGMSTEEIVQHMLLAGRLLWIKRREDEPLWMFPLDLEVA